MIALGVRQYVFVSTVTFFEIGVISTESNFSPRLNNSTYKHVRQAYSFLRRSRPLEWHYLAQPFICYCVLNDPQ